MERNTAEEGPKFGEGSYTPSDKVPENAIADAAREEDASGDTTRSGNVSTYLTRVTGDVKEEFEGSRKSVSNKAKVEDTSSGTKGLGGGRLPAMAGEGKGEVVVYVKGLPWTVNRSDLVKFFNAHGVETAEKGVQLLTNRKGKPMGHAYVKLKTQEDGKRALDMDGQYMSE